VVFVGGKVAAELHGMGLQQIVEHGNL